MRFGSNVRGARAAWMASLLVVAGCSLVVKSEVKGGGIGTACSANEECHAGICENGLCTATCSANAECPQPSACFAGKCQLPLKATALYVGVVAGGEGWSLTHHEGLKGAEQRLPYLGWDFKENVFGEAIGTSVDEAVAKGSTVIISNSFSQRDEILKKAEQYPNVSFLMAASFTSNGKNAGSFIGRLEQAWYIAGKVAAQKATKRIGIIGAFVNSESIRYINAYTLGARSVKPDIAVEVTWIGFWSDWQTDKKYDYKGERYYREELLTRRMIDSGCEVIAHLADNQRSVRLIERLTKDGVVSNVFSQTNDNNNAYREVTSSGPGAALRSCLGGAYWNWTPLYTTLLDQVHRGTWKPSDSLNEPMAADTRESVVGYELNPEVGIDDSAVRSYTNDVIQRGPEAIFRGPYAVTGQRDKNGDGAYDAEQTVADGETLSDGEFRSMCWFVKGVVEKTKPTDPTSPDRDAQVPDDKHPLVDLDPTVLDPPPGPPIVPRGSGFNCRTNQ